MISTSVLIASRVCLRANDSRSRRGLRTSIASIFRLFILAAIHISFVLLASWDRHFVRSVPFLSSRHRPRPDDLIQYPVEVLNRAADIFRMAGHMLGERLLLFLLHRGLVVDVVDDGRQPFPRRRD